ncbi:YvcK family protein [Patescibacteria group bacterium]|nr:MAG: YvcK family protein [Patescibacteria group bacterium]
MGESQQKKVVTIGGGTGTFVVLSGLKHIPSVSLKAVVSVADDGGSTGRLRDGYGFLPLGDARQALLALADENGATLMRALFNYRFSKGDIAGHNFGNLFLTALTDILGTDSEAIEAASQILRVEGRVVPVSDTPATLIAELENGESITCEHNIDERVYGRSPIKSLTAETSIDISHDAKDAVHEADVLILGPGDLYTSTLANFVVSGLSEEVKTSKAKLVYIMNLFTKAGQTDGYSAQNHIDAIERHIGRKPDIVVLHTGVFPEKILKRYADENEFPVVDDLPENNNIIRGVFADVVEAQQLEGDTVPRSFIRHNPEKISEIFKTLL